MVSKEKVDQMMNTDAAWASVLYLFQKHSKLQNYLTDDYFDFENGFINAKQLLKLSRLVCHFLMQRGK